MLNINNNIIISKNILYCNMDQKIISVIGGSGFIGNYLIDKLLELGYYVIIISVVILYLYNITLKLYNAQI